MHTHILGLGNPGLLLLTSDIPVSARVLWLNNGIVRTKAFNVKQ